QCNIRVFIARPYAGLVDHDGAFALYDKFRNAVKGLHFFGQSHHGGINHSTHRISFPSSPESEPWDMAFPKAHATVNCMKPLRPFNNRIVAALFPILVGLVALPASGAGLDEL